MASGAATRREQTIGQALREAFAHTPFLMLMAGYFVCGFQVVFIGVHMPSYLKDNGLSPQVASYALGLIGLFNIAGTYLAGSLGQRIPKTQILAFIYFMRAVAIGSFLGVWLGGYMYDRMGNYDLVWYLAIALGVFSAAVNMLVREAPIQRGLAHA